MPAAQKISTIQKLGIIAGGGVLPARLLAECRRKNIDVFMIGFRDQTDQAMMESVTHEWAGIGAAGFILEHFRKRDIRDLVLIGRIKRPNFKEIKLDLKGMSMLARMGFRAMGGDNSLLTALRDELQSEGFQLHGIHEFCEDLLAQEGFWGKERPNEDQVRDIHIGIKAARDLGRKDIGQAVVVQNGEIIDTEGQDGTDAMMRRCSARVVKLGHGPILIKTSKPQQDRNLDLPTIGPDTIQIAHEAGFSGVVFQAGATLVVEAKTIEDLADRYKMFVQAITVAEND